MIAIKGMKMPKSCAKCKLCEYNEHIGYYCVANNGGKFTMTREEMKKSRLEDCPLIEIITCKDCKHRDLEDKFCDCGHTIRWSGPREDNFYCADAEKESEEKE